MEIKHALDNPRVRSQIAAALGVTQQAITNWKARNSVPVEHCAAIEKLTNGEVTRKELRPSDWQSIWPELATSVERSEPKRKVII